METVLITGGAGFIGSNIAKKLVEKGYKIRVLDNFSTGKEENIQNLDIEVVKGDIKDIKTVIDASKGVSYIFHHAAQISVPASIEDPLGTMQDNGEGTLNVLMAARENKVKKVMFASSSAVYGDTVNLPIKEGEKTKPLSPYAVSKLLGEYYCQVFARLYDLEVAIFRYFNVFGDNQDPKSPYAAAIPKFLNLAKEDKPLTIYGNGSQTRDFVHVDDVVSANTDAMFADTGIEPINIGTGESIEMIEVATTISDKIKFEKEREGDIKHSLADISKAKEVLGFLPKIKIKEYLQSQR